jgi:acyl carrier protein
MSESKIVPVSQPPGREVIRQTLIELLEADTGEKYPDLDEKTPLREGLGLDSVDVVSIVSQIERRFRIRLTHEELQTLVTVGDVLTLLEVKVKESPTESKMDESNAKAA